MLDEGNAGCDGGQMDNALDWIVRNGGIDSEDDWPYDAEKGRCGWFAKKFRRPVRIDGFTDVPPEDEDALEKAVAMQPVSVAIEADHRSFQLYAGGVYAADDCGTQLDHGVLVVGYGFDADSPGHKHFWKVKNSWGDAWGEDGFIRSPRAAARPASAASPPRPCPPRRTMRRPSPRSGTTSRTSRRTSARRWSPAAARAAVSPWRDELTTTRRASRDRRPPPPPRLFFSFSVFENAFFPESTRVPACFPVL